MRLFSAWSRPPLAIAARLLWPAAILLATGAAVSLPVPPADPGSTEDPQRTIFAQCDSLHRAGHYSEAESVACALLEQITAQGGAESLQAAEAQTYITRARLNGRCPIDDRDIERAQHALKIRRSNLGPDHPDVAEGQWLLGMVYTCMGELATARSYTEQALAIHERANIESDPRTAGILVSLANLRARMGDYDGLEKLYERALRIQESVLESEHSEVSNTLLNYAIFAKLTGQYEKAQDLYKRTLIIHEKTLDGEHPRVARTYHNLANLLMYTGDYERARAAYLRAIEIRERTLGPEHLDVALSLKGLAIHAKRSGDLIRAHSAAQRALHICEQNFGSEDPRIAHSLAVLAGILSAMQDLPAADQMMQRAREILASHLGPDHPRVAEATRALAWIRLERGDLTSAEQLCREALAAQKAVLGEDHVDLGHTLQLLGNVYRATGDLSAAEETLVRALQVHQKAVGFQDAHVIGPLLDLGEIVWRSGDYMRAEEYLERAISAAAVAFGLDHPDYILGLRLLARVLYDTGRTREALEMLLESERRGRNYLRITSRGLPERLALRYATRHAYGFDLALTMTATPSQGEDEVAEVWNELVQSRALVLDEMAARMRVLGGSEDDTTCALREDLAAVTGRLAWLLISDRDEEAAEGFGDRFAHVRRRKEEIERRLAARSTAFLREQSRATVTLEDVTSSLPPQCALVAYVCYGHQQRLGAAAPDEREDPVDGTPSYAVLVHGAGRGALVAMRLGTAAELDLLISRWRDEVGRGAHVPERSPVVAEMACRQAGQELRRRIWDPVAPHLEGAGQVFIVPDGLLHLINFSALPLDQGRYLLDEPLLIHTVSAERDLVPIERRMHTGSGLLAIGAPDFDVACSELSTAALPHLTAADQSVIPRPDDARRGTEVARPEFREVIFTPLPAAAREVAEIATLWEQVASRRQDRSGRQLPLDNPDARVVRLTGRTASERAFKSLAGEFRVLHLATHGFFLSGKGLSPDAGVRGVGGTRPAAQSGSSARWAENPLLLSGLALAGANTRSTAGPEDEDGVVTAEEIAALDLTGVEWAVLSACESGLGEMLASEGVLGLRRAFQVAGAGTVIMSLWSIEDQIARKWMSALYRARLVGGLTSSEAVRVANRQLLAQQRASGRSTHPYYWAGFIACGDWR